MFTFNSCNCALCSVQIKILNYTHQKYKNKFYYRTHILFLNWILKRCFVDGRFVHNWVVNGLGAFSGWQWGTFASAAGSFRRFTFGLGFFKRENSNVYRKSDKFTHGRVYLFGVRQTCPAAAADKNILRFAQKRCHKGGRAPWEQFRRCVFCIPTHAGGLFPLFWSA